jgi:hypothetical protein
VPHSLPDLDIPSVPLLVFGPVAGAIVGIIQTLGAATVWSLHGQPEFYFGHSEDVKITALGLAIGGAVVGLAYGGVLLGFEWLFRRRIRRGLSFALIMVLSYVTAVAVAAYRFHVRRYAIEMTGHFAAQIGAVAMALVVAIATSYASRRRHHTPAIEKGGPPA